MDQNLLRRKLTLSKVGKFMKYFYEFSISRIWSKNMYCILSNFWSHPTYFLPIKKLFHLWFLETIDDFLEVIVYKDFKRIELLSTYMASPIHSPESQIFTDLLTNQKHSYLIEEKEQTNKQWLFWFVEKGLSIQNSWYCVRKTNKPKLR